MKREGGHRWLVHVEKQEKDDEEKGIPHDRTPRWLCSLHSLPPPPKRHVIRPRRLEKRDEKEVTEEAARDSPLSWETSPQGYEVERRSWSRARYFHLPYAGGLTDFPSPSPLVLHYQRFFDVEGLPLPHWLHPLLQKAEEVVRQWCDEEDCGLMWPWGKARKRSAGPR